VEIIAGRRGVYAVEVFDQDMLGDAEYKPRVLQVIRQHKLEVVSQQTSANSITVAIGGSLKRIKRVVNSLKQQLPCARVDTSKVSVVSVIGSDMQVPGILADAIGSLSKEGISILALNQSMRQVEIQFLVSESDYDNAIKVLHKRLVEVHDHQEAICAA
jgi:aspartate kinase